MSSDQPTETAPAASGTEGGVASSSNPPTSNEMVAMPADIRQEVEREQALVDLQQNVGRLEQELAKLKGEKSAVQGEKDEAIKTTNELRTQLSALQSEHHKTASEMSVTKTRIEAIDAEKRELVEENERIQEKASRNQQELYTLRGQKSDWSQKTAHLDVEVSELKMAAASAKFNGDRATESLQFARNEINSLSKSVAATEERFSRYRAEKVEFDTLMTRVTASESSHRALQRTYNDQSNRLAEAHARIAELTSTAAAKKASTLIESQRLREENRVLEKRSEDARDTIADREAELERIVTLHETEKKGWSDKWKAEERSRRAAEKRAEDLQAVVQRMALAGGGGSDLSSAAALAGEMRKEGKSYTQFYLDYTEQEGKLAAAEKEIERLTSLLDEISQEIAEKVRKSCIAMGEWTTSDSQQPLLDEQATEHAAAVERANALASELALVIAARDAFDDRVKSLEADHTLQSEETSSLRLTVDDLSRQIQALLRQVAILHNPALANLSIADNTPLEGDVISDELVEFKSIRALQLQNQKLVQLARQLKSDLTSRDLRRGGFDDDLSDGASLDQATEMITRLNTQLSEAQKKINEATRQRDFFSKLLARGEGLKWTTTTDGGPLDDGDSNAPHQRTIEALRGEIDGLRGKADEEIKVVKEDLRIKTEAAGLAEVAQAKADAKVTILEGKLFVSEASQMLRAEQFRSLTEVYTVQKQQFEGLEGQYRQIQGQISQAQSEKRTALEQIAGKQAEVDRLRTEAANLRAEREQWQSTEVRLQSDFRTVQGERAKLQQLIENLKNVATEGEKTKSEEKTRLEKRIQELQNESTTLREQIEQAKTATRAAESRVADFDSRLEAATASVRAEKTAAETLANSREEEINNLKKQLATVSDESDKRRGIGLNWKRRADTLQEQITGLQASQSGASDAKDKELTEAKEKEVAVQKELEETKTKLVEAEKKLGDSQRAEALKEGTVQRLQSELTAARKFPAAGGAATASAAPGVDQAALAALQTERDGLQTRITQLETDLETAKNTAANASSGVVAEGGAGLTDAERTELSTTLETLRKEKEGLEKKYEDNVTKVNRVNAQLRNRVADLSNTQTASESKIQDLERQLFEAQSSATAGSSGTTGETNPAAIDEAVKSATSTLTTQLSETRAELETLKATAAAGGAGGSEGGDVEARIAAARSEAEASAKKEVEDLNTKLKTLERQLKTAEITRKTLERQKLEAENKLRKVEGGGDAATSTTAGASGTPATGLSAGASEFKPSTTTTPTPAGVPTGLAATGGASVRGAARGRGVVRGAAVRGRGGLPGRASVLNAVNATIAASTSTPPTGAAAGAAGVTSPPSNKRPLPEDGEIVDSAKTTVTPPNGAAGAGPGRVLKRPRGAAPRGGAPGRGGAPIRRASQTNTPPGEASSGGGAGGQGGAGGDSGAGGGDGAA